MKLLWRIVWSTFQNFKVFIRKQSCRLKDKLHPTMILQQLFISVKHLKYSQRVILCKNFVFLHWFDREKTDNLDTESSVTSFRIFCLPTSTFIYMTDKWMKNRMTSPQMYACQWASLSLVDSESQFWLWYVKSQWH